MFADPQYGLLQASFKGMQEGGVSLAQLKDMQGTYIPRSPIAAR
jgi:hypothetical protein